MRWHLTLAVIVSAACAPTHGMAAPDDTATWLNRGLIARWHFAGTEEIASEPSAAQLNEIAAMPKTAALREQTLQKLALAPYNFLRNRTASTSDESALMRPLLDDVFRAESFVEVLDSTNEVPEMVFALKLNEDRARLWRTNIATALISWTAIPVTAINAEGFDGWELRKHKDPNIFRFYRAGNWVVLGWGEDKLELQPAVLRRIRQTTRPVDPDTTNWLDAWVDWPALAAHHLAPKSIDLPAMHLVVQGRKDFVRSEMTMKFAAPLGLTLDPWRIPTNAIRNRVVSFSAVRGFARRLNESAEAREFDLPPLPNQTYAWANAGIPQQMYLLAPVTDATNYFQRLQPGLLALVNSFLSHHTPVSSGAGPAHESSYKAVSTTNGEMAISGMPPFVAPKLRAVHDTGGDCLLAELWPLSNGKQPLPPQLVHEITAHDNLVYYGWEITGERIKQWHGLIQLGELMAGQVASDAGAPAREWIETVWPKLGNSATEVSLTAPDELTVVRNSTVGLTGIELAGLLYWQESPGFPWSAAHPPGEWQTAPQGPQHPH